MTAATKPYISGTNPPQSTTLVSVETRLDVIDFNGMPVLTKEWRPSEVEMVKREHRADIAQVQ